MTQPIQATGPIPFKSIFAQVQKVDWLWPGWLPLGYVTALIATPGTGKSALALWLAACAAGRLPNGQQPVWPDGQLLSQSSQTGDAVPSPVLWCESEARWGGHKTRAEELSLPIDTLYSVVPYDRTFRLDNASDMKKLEEACKSLKPKLIVIDSLAASHGQRENDAAMHRLLVPLQVLADRYKVCVLIIHHLRKEDSKNPRTEVTLDDMRGSTAIGAALLSVLALDRPDKLDPGNRRLRVVKANLALEPPAIGFRWLSNVDQQGQSHSEFLFGPPPEANGSGGGSQQDSANQLASAQAALLIALTTSFQPASQVIALCQKSNKSLNERTLRRAFDRMLNAGTAERVYQKSGPSAQPIPAWRSF